VVKGHYQDAIIQTYSPSHVQQGTHVRPDDKRDFTGIRGTKPTHSRETGGKCTVAEQRLTQEQIDIIMGLIAQYMADAEKHSKEALKCMEKSAYCAKQAANIAENLEKRVNGDQKPNLTLVTNEADD